MFYSLSISSVLPVHSLSVVVAVGVFQSQGQVYYPLTPLVAGAWDNNTAPFLQENFHWITEVEMIKQFKHYRPWTNLIDDLETIGMK
jgi:hypothetical protein